MGKLILIRHGQTDMNKDGIYYGRMDVPINDTGRKQAEKTREILKEFNLDYDKIYSSTMKRAKETAQIVNYKNLEIEESSLIREMDFGIFEGLTYDEIVKKYPEEMKKCEADWRTYSYVNGENPIMLQKRAIEFAESLDKTKNNLVVTHWGITCTLLSHYISGGIEGYWKFKIRNGGVAVIEFDGDFPMLTGFNLGGTAR